MSLHTLRTIALIAALLLALFVQEALAQTAQIPRNCAPHAEVTDSLASLYGEARQLLGLTARGSLVEVFASERTGTWTITITDPLGITCLIGSGNSYEDTSGRPAPDGDET